MMRWLLRLITVVMFAGSVSVVLDYWVYDEQSVNIEQLMTLRVTTDALIENIETAIKEERPEDARMYLQLAQQFNYQRIDPQHYETQLQILESPLNSAARSVSRFADGFLSGRSASAEGVAGAVVSDFTVIGDGRDLWEQYQLYHQDQPVNELIVTLAGVGVGLTAATVLSSGVAAPAKAGVSTLKVAARSGTMTPRFQKLLLARSAKVFDYQAFMRMAKVDGSVTGLQRAARQAYQPKAFAGVSDLASQTNNIRKATSIGDTVNLLRYVDNGQDLSRLNKLSLKYGMQTKGVMKLLGKAAIGTTRLLRRSSELVLSLLASFFSLVGMLFAWRQP